MSARDEHFLKLAARLAVRGHGGAEPNPQVGCAIVAPDDTIVGWGYHRQVGGPHAEIVALRRAGPQARGATLYCTLEPCSHTGRTPPCVDSIVAAGIKRVVIARRDPNPTAAGGLDRLKAAGVATEVFDSCEAAIAVSDPFVHRVRSGLPWVVAKWAQTLDGRIATRPPIGESQWISSEASRKIVHRERGRVDAILTGIGTVLKDDPMLTARGVRVRRIARRIVVDPNLETPPTSRLAMSAGSVPTTIGCDEAALADRQDRSRRLRDLGLELIGLPRDQEADLSLAALLRGVVERYDATNVLVEAGGGLLSRLFRQRLVNEAWVFIGPLLLSDEQAQPALTGLTAARLTVGYRLSLMNMRRRGDDVIVRYRVR